MLELLEVLTMIPENMLTDLLLPATTGFGYWLLVLASAIAWRSFMVLAQRRAGKVERGTGQVGPFHIF